MNISSSLARLTAPLTDRGKVLENILEERGQNSPIPWRTFEKDGARHFVLGPEMQGSVAKGSTVFIAHYDRAKGSPGANDNSVAVLLLIEAAAQLLAAEHRSEKENWTIILSDREETARGGKPQNQGSFALAPFLKGRDVFILDGAGVGDTLVISAMLPLLLDAKLGLPEQGGELDLLLSRVEALQHRVLQAAHSIGFAAMLLPVPFSDDAGLLAGGIAGQTLTVLPHAEAAAWEEQLKKDKATVRGLLTGSLSRRLLPPTWQAMNTSADTVKRLTPKVFPQILKLVSKIVYE